MPTIARATTRSRVTTCAIASSARFVYDLPFGANQRFGGGLHGPLGWIASGWQANGILTFQSGYPLLVSQGSNNVNLFNPVQRPNWTGQDATLNDQSRAAAILKWFDTSQFSTAPAFQFGSAPRVMPDLRSDGVKNLDFSLFKNNRFKNGKWNVQIRVEAFNLAEPDAVQCAEHPGRRRRVRDGQRRRSGAAGADRCEAPVLIWSPSLSPLKPRAHDEFTSGIVTARCRWRNWCSRIPRLYRDLAERERESRMIVDSIPGLVPR